ncbi:MAG TPA: HEPN domain-containing protein [Methanospirillum sp.]|nr:HEPN domain-containing protein [Methanospirillum sp.]
MAERSSDWFTQARHDLETAGKNADNGAYEWACFIAEQAAEKALKAVYQKKNAEAWGHSVSDLLRGIDHWVEVSDELIRAARRLDSLYIPTRYPNGHSHGVPHDQYDKEDSDSAIRSAGAILRFCEDILA